MGDAGLKDSKPGDREPGRALRLAAGGAMLATGVVLLFIPGPGIPLVAGGLLILEKDVPWARRFRRRLVDKLEQLGNSARPR